MTSWSCDELTGSRVVVWECSEGQTDRQTAVANLHFASAMPDAKCNNSRYVIPAEENVMPFRHVIGNSEEGSGTGRSLNITHQTTSIVIHNNGSQELGRFFDVISSSGTIYRLRTGR